MFLLWLLLLLCNKEKKKILIKSFKTKWKTATAHKYDFASCVVDRCMNMSGVVFLSLSLPFCHFNLLKSVVAYVCAYILINVFVCPRFFLLLLLLHVVVGFLCVPRPTTTTTTTKLSNIMYSHNWIVFKWRKIKKLWSKTILASHAWCWMSTYTLAAFRQRRKKAM